MERRYLDMQSAGVTIEERADGAERIVGLAAVYYDGSPGTEFKLFDGLVERIMPGAFDGVLGDDVRGLFNHEPSLVLGRRTADTLSLSATDRGLQYDITPGDTQAGRDTVTSIQRRDVQGSSFSFSMGGDGEAVFREIGDDLTVREIIRVGRLFDVGPVTFPAYEATSTGLRSVDMASVRSELDKWQSERGAAVAERVRNAASKRIGVRMREIEAGTRR